MPGQIKLITVDFSHRLQQLRPNLGTHFNGTCQLLATKSYQNTLPLIINMLKLQQTTEHLSGLWIFCFGLGFWLSTPLFFFSGQTLQLVGRFLKLPVVSLCGQPAANTSSMILLHPKKKEFKP